MFNGKTVLRESCKNKRALLIVNLSKERERKRKEKEKL